MVTELGA